MQRITVSHLEAIIARINRAMNTPANPYVLGADGRHHAQPGNYRLSRAYGGFCLHQMVNEGGGVRDVFLCGHVPARDLANRMHAFLSGVESARRGAGWGSPAARAA
jgi:hypothetical protein